jgi:glycosyltransferase involved in cell wall biosynthesis
VLLTDQPELAEGTRVRAVPLDLGPKLSRRNAYSLGMRWPLLLRAMRHALAAVGPYDVLVLHFKKEQLLSALLRRRLRPRLVWMEWGPLPIPFRRGIPAFVYRFAARKAGVVLAISEGTRRTITDLGIREDKVTVIPNALRADELRFDAGGRERVREQLGVGPSDFLVGCISRLHPKKRNDVVVEAVGRLGDGARLVMAGEGETESDLRAQAKRLGVAAHFLPTPREDLNAVLSAFDVSVFCPSPTEGAPRAVIIAMLAGRPCISTGSEGVVDLIEPGTGAIVEPDNDVGRLAELLTVYRDDPARRARDGTRARERAAERFDAPVVGRLLERIFSA